MPKLLRINNIGLNGLNTDIAPWELDQNYLTSIRNVRIASGSIESSGGSKDWSTAGNPFNPGYLMPVGAINNDYWVVCGRTAVNAFDGTTWQEISSVRFDTGSQTISVVAASGTLTRSSGSYLTDGFAPGDRIHLAGFANTSGVFTIDTVTDTVITVVATEWSLLTDETGGGNEVISAVGYTSIGTDQELDWTGCVIGAIPVINNPQTYPEYWTLDPSTPLAALPFDSGNTWEDMNYRAKVVRSHKNFLFALGLTEGSVDYPDSFRWSHPADANSIPASWDETDTAFLAGKAALGGDGGAIVDGLSLRDSFVIYSEKSIDILDYTADEFVWRRRELSSTVGALSRDCIIEVKGQHFMLADGDIVMNDGNTIKSIVHNRIRKRLLSQMNVDHYAKSRAIRNNAFSEIWFCVPEDQAETPNVAYIYNWKDDSWSIRDLPSGLTSVAFGPQAEPATTWNSIDGTWDSSTGVWGSRTVTPLNDTPIGIIGATSKLVYLDPKEGGSDYSSVIERINYPLETARNVTTITRVFPNIDGTQIVRIQFGSQDYPSGPIRWKPAVNFDPSSDRKIDVRTTGELHCWRISSTGSKLWRLSGMDIEYSNTGER